MHYEDLTIIGIRKSDDNWVLDFSAKLGNFFAWPIADSSVEEEQLTQSGIFIGRKVLGVVQNDRLVGLNELPYIKADVMKR